MQILLIGKELWPVSTHNDVHYYNYILLMAIYTQKRGQGLAKTVIGKYLCDVFPMVEQLTTVLGQ